ncbi:hypothetical protein CEXT_713321 [Caerostris extrusa]|uniref:Uncharacterized protein n=1 Tax=Caerostris extrusa TaxID=172846 RepID=A0AAV4QPS9_CAEEX|nr:hypothetical protein CEXT_713321 [Caerostris extrusa]
MLPSMCLPSKPNITHTPSRAVFATWFCGMTYALRGLREIARKGSATAGDEWGVNGWEGKGSLTSRMPLHHHTRMRNLRSTDGIGLLSVDSSSQLSIGNGDRYIHIADGVSNLLK